MLFISYVRYVWTKNGAVLNIDSISNIQIQSQGTIIINPVNAADAGYYQCLVSNTWGTTATNSAYLQQAFLAPFTALPGPVTAAQGQSVRLSCNPPQSVPTASYAWYKSTGDDDLNPVLVATDSRIQVNQQTGEIHEYDYE